METIRLNFFILTHLCTKFSFIVLLPLAHCLTVANCLKDNEHGVMWLFSNLLNKHKQVNANAKIAKATFGKLCAVGLSFVRRLPLSPRVSHLGDSVPFPR